MIAEAIKIARPGAKSISVDLATIRYTNAEKGVRYTYLTPRIAQVQLVRFDQGKTPDPFEFQLRRGQVTKSGNTKPPRLMSEKQLQQRREAVKKLHQKLRSTKIVVRDKTKEGVVHDRIGGQTPPLQVSGDGVPFSRRRAFGLRALEY